MNVARQARRVRRRGWRSSSPAPRSPAAASTSTRASRRPRSARHGRDGRRRRRDDGAAAGARPGRQREGPDARARPPHRAAGQAVRARLPDRRPQRPDRARLRRRAHQAHALHRRAPRHDRLPAPAPDREPGRHLVGPRHPPRRGLLPRVRRLLRRREALHARRRPHRRRLGALPGAARARRSVDVDGLRVAPDRGRHQGRRGVRARVHGHPRRHGRSPSRTTWAPRATSWRCARAISRSCTCTPTRTA